MKARFLKLSLLAVFVALVLAMAGLWAAYESKRKSWAQELMPATFAPCLRLGGFGLPADSNTLLIAGDSRLQMSIKPELLSERLECRTRSIGDAIILGGNIATLNLVLSHLTQDERRRISLLILNLSALGLNDIDPSNLTGNEFNHYSLITQARLALYNPRSFFKVAKQQLWPNQIAAWRGKHRPPPRSCLGDFKLSESEGKNLGFYGANPDHEPLFGLSITTPYPVFWGIRYQSALRQLETLNRLDVPFLLFFPPLRSELCSKPEYSPLCEGERNLPIQLRQDLPWLGDRIMDAVNRPPRELESGHFIDLYHANIHGAQVISVALADSLARRGLLIKKAAPH